MKAGYELGSFSLEKRRLQNNLTAAFQYLMKAYKEDRYCLFTWSDNNRTRGNGFRLSDGRNRIDVMVKIFTQRVVRHRLPRAVDAPSLEVFEAKMVGAFACPCPWQMSWNWITFNDFSNPRHLMFL